MEAFDCLDPATAIEGALFLEASAGTGKTFAIEHVALRLMEKGMALDEILLVTFTRAATRDLKMRIHATLRKAEITTVDEGEIFTIHSFCHRMLSEFAFEAGLSFEVRDPDDRGGREELKQSILDVLRAIHEIDAFSPAQLYQVMRFCDRDITVYVRKIMELIDGDLPLQVAPSYREAKAQIDLTAVECDELLELTKHYKGCVNRAGEIHTFLLEQIEAVRSGHLETLIRAHAPFYGLLEEGNGKKGAPPIPEKLASLFKQIEEIRSPENTLHRLAQMTRERIAEDKRQSPDMLLQLMRRAIQIPAFIHKVRAKYRAIIVDEFQDTDPLQWEIFHTLFFGHTELFLVVGDPKQSIYSFRGSDLDTFLKAKELFPSVKGLFTNYRSDPSLVSALNKLFQPLGYPPVLAGRTESLFSEEESIQLVRIKGKKGRSTIWPTKEMEENLIFPYIANEISALKERHALSYDAFAILIKDRFQALRLKQYLTALGLPTLATAALPLAETRAFLVVEHDLPEEELEGQDLADLRDIRALLLEGYTIDEIRAGDANEDPSFKQRPIQEGPAITIMTSHMSKGLEFDIVFALGLASRTRPTDIEAEKLRLLYVACTRAARRLYLFQPEGDNDPAPGTASPIELLAPTLPFIELEGAISTDPIPTPERSLKPKPDLIFIPTPTTPIFSFSSLYSSSVPLKVAVKEDTLPPGSETGQIFHLIFEKLLESGRYYAWDDSAIKEFVKEEIALTHLQDWEEEVFSLVHAAFHTPLADFTLRNVHPSQILQEIPFLYALPEYKMKGFMDLLFFHEGRYYILDWKLNLLPDYTPSTLQEAMEEHHYAKQAAIYQEALRRHLATIHPDIPFADLFGATFYFFLRGHASGLIHLAKPVNN